MSNEYQSVYDAVRSRMSHISGSEIIERIAEKFDISHDVVMLRSEFMNVAYEQQRPSVLYRPKIIVDGNQWCALYGDDLQDGVAGFGDSVADAMADFDNNWIKKLNK